MKNYIFTSESVSEGHPDKICDWIADHILDEALSQDKNAKMAVEATIKDDLILVYGEANTTAVIDYATIAKTVLKKIGYEEEYQVMVKVNRQSPEIFNAVTSDHIVHAGDQGIMFGYACDETPELMPLSITLAHQLAHKLREVRRTNSFLKPDSKTQVSVKYVDGKIHSIDTIVISTQHAPEISQQDLRAFIIENVILPTVNHDLLTEETKYFINPSGLFTIGGSFGDSGTTGRKIVVDTYGGHGRIGGGCFSSKDPSKVDRSAAYYARFVAKNLVAHGLVSKCEIQLSYAIGQTHPISVFVETFDTHNVPIEKLHEIIHNNFDFSVANIINELDLLRPIYASTTNYGHFGKDYLPWEQIKTLTK
jgi:S-adenosylmethionine synthetase